MKNNKAVYTVFGYSGIENAFNESIDFIIKRNDNLNGRSFENDMEDICEDYFHYGAVNFILIIGGKRIDLNCTTTRTDAEYIRNNINKIEYLYCDSHDYDSVVGDIDKFLFNIGVDHNVILHYSEIVEKAGFPKTKEEIENAIVEFVKDNLEYDNKYGILGNKDAEDKIKNTIQYLINRNVKLNSTISNKKKQNITDNFYAHDCYDIKLIICERTIELNAFTSKEDAVYVNNNIDKITYFYFPDND